MRNGGEGRTRREEEEKREKQETQVVSNQDFIFQPHLTVVTSPRSYILSHTGVKKFNPSHVLLCWLSHLDCLHLLFQQHLLKIGMPFTGSKKGEETEMNMTEVRICAREGFFGRFPYVLAGL